MTGNKIKKQKLDTFSNKVLARFNNSELKLTLTMLLILITIRYLVGLSYASGEDDHPKYGDYECHRTWLEVTTNMPIEMWYTDNQYMNISYWPMDYPPLCAYTHWLMGKTVNISQPDAVKLGESYGYNNWHYRTVMRSFVILQEFLIFAPALYLVISTLYSNYSTVKRKLMFFAIMVFPPTLFIDHGHFQFN